MSRAAHFARAIRKQQLRGAYPDGKVYGADMGPIWGWQDPGGPHVGPMNFAIWIVLDVLISVYSFSVKGR